VAVLALTKEAANLWGEAKEGVTDSVSFIPIILGTVIPQNLAKVLSLIMLLLKMSQ